ncbi:MAG: polyphosphate kinase 2 [Hyphomicrobiales bacterium]
MKPEKEQKPLDESFYSLDFDAVPKEIEERAFKSGNYPYDKKLDNDDYENELETLQVELMKVQKWVIESGERIVVIFEGRDAAGKGGTIKRFIEHLNPRNTNLVALSKPSEAERGEWYFQRYIRNLPTAGQFAMFDRSWYNRAGVERVMGFCSQEQVYQFFREVPRFEEMLVRDGIKLFKFWLTIGREAQLERFYARKTDPLKQWKLSPIDYKSLGKWDEYTMAIHDMFGHSHTDFAPWTVIKSNDKKRARLNALRVFLTNLDYDGKDEKAIPAPDKKIAGPGTDYI